MSDLPPKPALPADVESALAELEQIESFVHSALSDELRAMLLLRKRAAAVGLADRMIAWRRGEAPPLKPLSSQVLEHLTPHVPPPAPAPTIDAAECDETKPPPAEVVRRRLVTIVSDPSLPPVPPPPRVASPVASATALSGLRDRYAAGEFLATAPSIDPEWPAFVERLTRELAPMGNPSAELDAIVHATEGWERWKSIPSDVQRGIAAWLAARLHVLQDVAFPDDPRVSHAFSLLSAFMKKARPGFVHGLARTHRPVGASWEDDADLHAASLEELLPQPPDPPPAAAKALPKLEALVKELHEAPEELREAVLAQLRRDLLAALNQGLSARHPRLVRLVRPIVDSLDETQFRALRRAVRTLVEDEAAAEDDASEPAVMPADWPWWGWTRGRRAVMVGGSPREVSRARLERTFEFSELVWVPAEYRRNTLQTVRDRVRAGGVDLVVILRSFVGHDADQVILPACRETGVGWVSVEQGYGVARFRQGIERYVRPEDCPQSAR